jgi:multisubunit Na+/H+ antiporter MnhB subunit
MRRKLIAFLIFIIGVFTVSQSLKIGPLGTLPMADYYIDNSYRMAGSSNVVTSVYLYFRYYDTLFEALMLLFSIIGVIYMSIHEGEDYDD